MNRHYYYDDYCALGKVNNPNFTTPLCLYRNTPDIPFLYFMMLLFSHTQISITKVSNHNQLNIIFTLKVICTAN